MVQVYQGLMFFSCELDFFFKIPYKINNSKVYSKVLIASRTWRIMCPMETLAKLFGGQARVRIMRLFLLNNNNNFEIEEVVSRSRVMKATARKEINALSTMNFIKQKVITKEGYRGTKKKVMVW